MKTYKDYVENFFGSGVTLEEYLKNGDIVDAPLVLELIQTPDGDICREELEEWAGGCLQAKLPVDVYGNEGIYDTVARRSQFEHFVYCGQCKRGEIINRSAAVAKRIYICTPYRAGTQEDIDKNVEAAREICARIIKEGNCPVAPHLYFPQFMNDDNELEREFGLQAGLEALRNCDEIYALIKDDYISEGLARELSYAANALDIPVKIDRVYTKREKR